MGTRRRIFLRVALCVVAIIALGNFCHLQNLLSSSPKPAQKIENSLFLDEQQCRINFPGLTKEIDDAVARGPFVLEKQPLDFIGLVQARIKDGKMYVIGAQHKPNVAMKYERDAVLQQLNRAILTSPTPLPDTIFTFSITDQPRKDAWSFCRSNDPRIISVGNYWVMPHFSFWSWPREFIGSIDDALAKIDLIEDHTTWQEKIDKVVWRGTGWFSSVGNPDLRWKLLQTTKDKPWADTEAMKWETNAEKASNSIRIENFCKYKYIIYTEGVTYSGRLLYHQACNSVIITAPPGYLMHTTHLMKPVYASTLVDPHSLDKNAPNQRWPVSYPAEEANIVFVDPDWKNLEQTVEWLQAHPRIAEGIARRQRELVSERGYLSPAAEACYWRSLIRGWASVVRPNETMWGKMDVQGIKDGEGIRWETFSLTEKESWDY